MHLLTFQGSPDSRDAVSLFSGAMGLDIGLGDAGLNVRIGQDSDESCTDTMRANRHEALKGDIRGISPDTVLGKAGLARGEPFLVCGGPPCQPFSTAGRRLGILDPRGSLFMEFIRMVDYIRPRFFLMENVKGLMSSTAPRRAGTRGIGRQVPHDPLRVKPSAGSAGEAGAVNEAALDVVLSEFSRLGYSTIHGVLDAVDYGVPQFRERFMLLGSRDHERIFLPVPTHFQTHQDGDYRWRTLRYAIRDMEDDPGEHAEFSMERLSLLKLVPAGGNWRDLPTTLVKRAMGGAFESGGGKVGFYRRLDYDQPSPTLVTSPVQKASMLCHPTRNRPLSVREYARIQQFPDGWSFCGNMASRYRQIGNAVPIGLASAVGKAIIAAADGKATVKTKRMRGTDVHRGVMNGGGAPL
ncbi:MAG: DNA cytosine methyltransferase [Deltaproteobacteria bacterium]|jgi:DNA (cytosine-5)-methyltransferase 1|nr:DNA cytosine methyltransferase [Deltaproteobacteria bacterium]